MQCIVSRRCSSSVGVKGTLSDPDQWWGDTVDLIVFGLKKILERRREHARESAGPVKAARNRTRRSLR